MADPLTLQFGYNAGIPDDTTAVWGARWIITQDGMVDELPDRVDAVGRTGYDSNRLLNHLIDKVKRKPHDKLRDMLRAGEVRTREAAEVVLYDDGIVRAVGNTNGSAGYFYVIAYLIPTHVGERTGLTLDAIRSALDEVRASEGEDTDERELALLRDLRDLTLTAIDAQSAPALFLLHINHRHGDTYSTHPTLEAAIADLDDWVNEWWDRELPDVAKPDDAMQARCVYFDLVPYEGADVIDLTSGEGVSLDAKN